MTLHKWPHSMILALVCLMVPMLGCGSSNTAPAPEPELLGSKMHGRHSLSPGEQSTRAEYELKVGVFENPRTSLVPDYVLFDGYSYSAGDAGRVLVIAADEDDADFTKMTELLTDGERNALLFETQRVDGGGASLFSTDFSIAQAAGLDTEDFTGMRITEFHIHIERLQVVHEAGETIEAVDWRLDIYGYR